MYTELVFENFFNDERQNVLTDIEQEFALSLITPKQAIHAEPLPYNPLCKYHLDLCLQIISDIYKIEKPINKSNRELYCLCLLSEIAKYIKNGEKNFIISRYILSNSSRYTVMELPYYITPKEYQELKELEKIYKGFKISTSATIYNYDPIYNCNLDFPSVSFGDDTSTLGLTKALEYLEDNKCIVEYELNAPKEYILK